MIAQVDRELDGLEDSALSWYALNSRSENNGNVWHIVKSPVIGRLPMVVTASMGNTKYVSGLYGRLERRCAFILSKFKRDNKCSFIHFTAKDNDQLGESQIVAIKMALCGNPLSVITGGPGTGKTTIAKTIVRTNKLPTIGCSPTGKGADVLRTSINRDCYTVHRLTAIINEGRLDPSQWDTIISDESGMLSIDVLEMFLTALYRGGFNGRIIFMGDSGQLPSIGPGKVLDELIECLPTTKLDIAYRYSDYDIGLACDYAAQGKLYVPTYKSDYYRLVTGARANDHWDEYMNMVSIYGSQDTRLITYHTDDSFSVNSIALRKLRDKPPIVCNKNNYEEKVFNGQCGYMENGKLHFGGMRKFPYSIDWSYAYASTCHKAQGGQWNGVVVWVNSPRYISKEWLRTACSRAVERLTVVVRDADTTERCLASNKTADKRISLLSAFVKGEAKWDS